MHLSIEYHFDASQILGLLFIIIGKKQVSESQANSGWKGPQNASSPVSGSNQGPDQVTQGTENP